MRRQPSLNSVYRLLYEAYGRQYWWPAESPFEVMLGAILTQNTSWTGAARALGNLRSRQWLTPARICNAQLSDLARHLRPSGTYRVKAVRLRNFCCWYLAQGEYTRLRRLHTADLRGRLLELSGIGPETADAILLYAFNRPVFVVDAYTRRILARLGFAEAGADYESLRSFLESRLPRRTRLYNEFHALLVQHAKELCRRQPLCAQCSLRAHCAAGRSSATH